MSPITAYDAVDLLNQALFDDREAITKLFEHRVSCNEALAYHPTIQVSEDFQVGFLGLLNGIFGVNESQIGHICAVYEGGKLTRFAVLFPTVIDGVEVDLSPGA